jgi:hypothetical protein
VEYTDEAKKRLALLRAIAGGRKEGDLRFLLEVVAAREQEVRYYEEMFLVESGALMLCGKCDRPLLRVGEMAMCYACASRGIAKAVEKLGELEERAKRASGPGAEKDIQTMREAAEMLVGSLYDREGRDYGSAGLAAGETNARRAGSGGSPSGVGIQPGDAVRRGQEGGDVGDGLLQERRPDADAEDP